MSPEAAEMKVNNGQGVPCALGVPHIAVHRTLTMLPQSKLNPFHDANRTGFPLALRIA